MHIEAVARCCGVYPLHSLTGWCLLLDERWRWMLLCS